MSKLTLRIAAATVGVILFAAGLLVGATATSASEADPLIPPCHAEDGSGPAPCLWDARERGNGQGRSFISPNGDADGEIIYLDEQ